jgi:zinc transporter, ZIP family
MENAPIAFAVVSLAGLSTMLGATVVLLPWLHKYATRRILAISLAFASGVMIYISFVDIFPKATASFGAAGVAEKYCSLLATVCFFAGIVAVLVRFCVPYLLPA